MWRTWDYRQARVHRDQIEVIGSIHVNDGGGSLGQSGYDGYGEMWTDLSGI